MPGDIALARMLGMHNLIMNGGVHHALDMLSPDEVEAAIAGFVYFDVQPALAAVTTVLNTPHLREWTDANEAKANALYYTQVPDDELLVTAFDKRYLATPEEFEGP